jgi:hypothetical protein
VHHARRLLADAELHLATAEGVADSDDKAGAFTLAYDAVRKAMAAVLAAGGLRVKVRGGHWAGRVLLVLAYPDDADTYSEQQWMSEVRNRAEYPDFEDPYVFQSDVTEGLVAARSILRAAIRAVDNPILWEDDTISP